MEDLKQEVVMDEHSIPMNDLCIRLRTSTTTVSLRHGSCTQCAPACRGVDI